MNEGAQTLSLAYYITTRSHMCFNKNKSILVLSCIVLFGESMSIKGVNMKKEITTRKIFGLCLGDASRGFLYGIITTYLLTFFIPTSSDTSLPIFIVNAGIALAIIRCIGMVVDAFTDPWIANMSDRHQGKSGRRIPFMRIAAIPYALCCILIFFPPFGEASILNAVWVGIFLCLYYIFQTLYNIPFMALQIEVVSNTQRRVFLFTISSLMFVIASVLVFLTSTFKGMLMGMGIPELWALRIPFIIFATLGAITALIPAFLIKEKDYVTEPKDTHVPLLESLKATFSYRNFRIIAVGYLIMWIAFAFFNATLVYYIENLLALPSMWVTVVSGISVLLGICSYPLLNFLVKRIGKKPLLIFACSFYVLIYTSIYLYQPITAALGGQIFAILIGVCIAFPIACTNILPSSIVGDLAQYDSIKTGKNRTGMFVGARNFIEKLSQAAILLVIPNVLVLNSLDGAATAFGIQTTALIAAISVALAVFVYSRYNEREVTGVIEKANKATLLASEEEAIADDA